MATRKKPAKKAAKPKERTVRVELVSALLGKAIYVDGNCLGELQRMNDPSVYWINVPVSQLRALIKKKPVKEQ